MTPNHLAALALTVHRDVLNREHHGREAGTMRHQLDGILTELAQTAPVSVVTDLTARLAENERMQAEWQLGCDECRYCDSDSALQGELATTTRDAL